MTHLIGFQVFSFCILVALLMSDKQPNSSLKRLEVHVLPSRSSPMISESPNSNSPLSRKSLSRTRQLGSHTDPGSESTEVKKRGTGTVKVLFVGVRSGKEKKICWSDSVWFLKKTKRAKG